MERNYITLTQWQCNMVQITIQTAQTVMACRNVRYLNYFTVTGGERFYYVFERFFYFPAFHRRRNH